MQFLKTTWARWGVVAPRRPAGATPDYDNAYDSIYSAANYICAGADRLDDLNAAILRYNHSQSYVDTVLAKAAEYRAVVTPAFPSGLIVAGAYTLPVDRAVFDAHPDYLTKPHHDYPAADIPVPTGTPVYAVTNGHVIAITAADSKCGNGIVLAGADDFRYIFCHGSQVVVAVGQGITVGQTIMLSGNTGNSTGPHLHFGVETASEVAMCPQPLLVAWYQGTSVAPPTTTSGCSY
jgi:murein DD-endopeptidase MepM/ murein hydrolase activator NlpD